MAHLIIKWITCRSSRNLQAKGSAFLVHSSPPIAVVIMNRPFAPPNCTVCVCVCVLVDFLLSCHVYALLSYVLVWACVAYVSVCPRLSSALDYLPLVLHKE